MQLNPARGRKLLIGRPVPREDRQGLCSSTPRGDGNLYAACAQTLFRLSGLCSSTPRGDGNLRNKIADQIHRHVWFMQLNPARGRKHGYLPIRYDLKSLEGLCSSTPRGDGNENETHHNRSKISRGLCSSTPRGDGNKVKIEPNGVKKSAGLCSSTPRGDGNTDVIRTIINTLTRWFMQLNPARGRKQGLSSNSSSTSRRKVYAAQPREGTETQSTRRVNSYYTPKVYAAQPREGTETSIKVADTFKEATGRFMQLNPARGRKPERTLNCNGEMVENGLCSSTPRGDGNKRKSKLDWSTKGQRVYAAQPREGTETTQQNVRELSLSVWFMQLNPARGRKLTRPLPSAIDNVCVGLCSSTPRGDGNIRKRVHTTYKPCVVYAAQPREGTETDLLIKHFAALGDKVYAAQPREGTETRG